MEEFVDLRNHIRQKLLFRLFWANERLDRWGTWPAPGRRSTGLGHQDPRSGEPSSRTGPPYSSWKNGEWKIQPRICGKCGFFFFHLGGMFSTTSGCPLRWGAIFARGSPSCSVQAQDGSNEAPIIWRKDSKRRAFSFDAGGSNVAK